MLLAVALDLWPVTERGRAIRALERAGFVWFDQDTDGFESPPPGKDPLEITTLDPTVAAAIRSLDLKHISLAECEELRDIDALHGLKSLRWLNLNLCERLENLDGLQGLTGLRLLTINVNRSLRNLDPLHDLTSLRMLNLDSCLDLQNVDGVEKLVALKMIVLSHSPALENVDSLKLLPGLKEVDLGGCRNLPKSSWAPLCAALPNTQITLPDGSVHGPAWNTPEDFLDGP
jgi:hypothetical protein